MKVPFLDYVVSLTRQLSKGDRSPSPIGICHDGDHPSERLLIMTHPKVYGCVTPGFDQVRGEYTAAGAGSPEDAPRSGHLRRARSVKAVRHHRISERNVTMQELQSRLPNPMRLVPELGEIGGALFRATGNGSVPQTTISMLQLRAGQIVGNDYLTTLHTGNLRKAGEAEERIAAVASWRAAACLTDGERIALALVEAVLTANPSCERVSDDLYARASQHYDDKALTTLIMAIGQVCFFIPLAVIGKPLPGVSPAQQWRQ
ncbi:carboxymuconolactone decarboxylase family protein [Actinoplanes derwentensis]|uniref:carboxymuconolactone decarboxylase family protein n=1 Tax=Actinoplanes derwentensis TaxID=113562 RepID=UPI0018D2AEE0|nr:carboxymuconolactone decarboxylase family protein [Actinoplanes derwentensis]